jgi:hypothetical protein
LYEAATAVVNNGNLIRAMIEVDTDPLRAMLGAGNKPGWAIVRQLVRPYFEAALEAGDELFDGSFKERHQTDWGHDWVVAEGESYNWRVVATISVFRPGGATPYHAYVARREVHMPLHAMVGEFFGQEPHPLLTLHGLDVLFLPACCPSHRYHRFKAGWESVGVLISLDIRPLIASEDKICEWGRPNENVKVITLPPTWESLPVWAKEIPQS